jgi:hypothetical protein
MQTFEEHTGAYLLLLQEVIQLVDFHGWSVLVFVAEL